MDKVKIALAILKKYHFWFLCGLIILVSLGAWVTATADLTQRFDARKQQLDGSFSSVERISSVSPHPNQKVIDAIDDETTQLKQDVFAAWQTLYQEQTEKNKLADELNDQFKREFKQGGEISRESLIHYQHFILARFETLFDDILNVYRPVDGASTPAAPAPDTTRRSAARPGQTPKADSTQEMTGIVKWDGRFDLRNSFDWPDRPTTEKVRTSQEDLWVYEALFRVIHDTNLDPTATEPIGHHNAAIQEIVSLQIGGDTFESSGNSFGEQNVPKARYVDQGGQPLPEGAPRAAEYNIMPILMLVSIDQTKIPKLLVECGNSSMPIEVRNVRIRPGQGQTLDLGGVASAGSRAKAGPSFGSNLPTGATYIPVEIQGLIYIYNPPDSDKLGTGAIAELPDATQPATDTTPQPGPAAGEPAPMGPGSAEAPITDPTQE
ncbi:MAG TPA: hypothetical protein VE890_03300 [Thermoguttaceae bacterium]|nr:hypothetical protein [Thermoguttaceae bacterium]